MKLFVDRVVPAPPGWTWAQTAKAAIETLKSHPVEMVSLYRDVESGVPQQTSELVALEIERRQWYEPDWRVPEVVLHDAGGIPNAHLLAILRLLRDRQQAGRPS